jgi:nitrate/nitrite transport system substrate-binding protein
MKRRQFLQYSTLTAAGFTVAACTSQGSTHFNAPPANFGKLEKTDLKIGIVSSLDCLPLVVAKEKGMFKKYGLDVTLVKQPLGSWCSRNCIAVSWMQSKLYLRCHCGNILVAKIVK